MAHPRKAMAYDALAGHRFYDNFKDPDTLVGQMHHTRAATAHWKDSPLVYQLLSELSPPRELLDYGCGTGYMSVLASELGFSVRAVEPSPPLAESVAARREVRAVYPSLSAAIAVGEPVQVALAMHVVEHLADPLEEVSRLREVLRPEGLLVVVVPNVARSYYRFGERGSELRDQLADFGEALDHPPHHLTRFTVRGLRSLLLRAGFTGVACAFAPVGLWDLFYDGLGDERFAFESYFSTPAVHPLVAAIEEDLDEVLAHLDLQSLGISVVALASNIEPEEDLAGRLARARSRLFATYRESVGGSTQRVFDLVSGVTARAQAQELAAREDRIASLEAMLAGKDAELRAREKALHEAEARLRSLIKR